MTIALKAIWVAFILVLVAALSIVPLIFSYIGFMSNAALIKITQGYLAYVDKTF